MSITNQAAEHAQSQVAALRAYPAARSARAFQRRAPRTLSAPPFVALVLDRQAVLSRNVARRSLAPWMLVLLSNPGALWQPAATTCGVSIRTLALICLLRGI
ncbi:hypothetical protein EMIHUDRAFT_258180 [Emiliania huxleyi CCMP1516]|uniref:Uncharacterized protein n=2 Tax=Emiliania huxleyi TaxID=2903 RepID=A0A0D3IBR7_EMIH1|nr:hypothetical protein EMIHUDRAFT_258180 [Emiliania huxleyi CCMP1516]EOD08702.1 hypothetical protein EMIHUDRAFT_258180 [Emiliania huxleyi CCMP1516]|eukprot:XP_005761131.1 hypothetical protein EMIHUDRAFT_258180 [Emiliania huxleyi CCMP1516]